MIFIASPLRPSPARLAGHVVFQNELTSRGHRPDDAITRVLNVRFDDVAAAPQLPRSMAARMARCSTSEAASPRRTRHRAADRCTSNSLSMRVVGGGRRFVHGITVVEYPDFVASLGPEERRRGALLPICNAGFLTHASREQLVKVNPPLKGFWLPRPRTHIADAILPRPSGGTIQFSQCGTVRVDRVIARLQQRPVRGRPDDT